MPLPCCSEDASFRSPGFFAHEGQPGHRRHRYPKAKPHGLAYSPAPDASARDSTHLITTHMLAARVRHEQPSRKVVTTP